MAQPTENSQVNDNARHVAAAPRPPHTAVWRTASADNPRAELAAAQRNPTADRQPPIIEVPNSFRARKGTRVGDSWMIGEALGTGLQVRTCSFQGAHPVESFWT